MIENRDTRDSRLIDVTLRRYNISIILTIIVIKRCSRYSRENIFEIVIRVKLIIIVITILAILI